MCIRDSPKAPIYAMVHLVPEKLERRYSKAQIKKSSRFVTEIVTLGSSLTCYLNDLGIENVYTSFHYVDNNYYTPSANLYNLSLIHIFFNAVEVMVR